MSILTCSTFNQTGTRLSPSGTAWPSQSGSPRLSFKCRGLAVLAALTLAAGFSSYAADTPASASTSASTANTDLSILTEQIKTLKAKLTALEQENKALRQQLISAGLTPTTTITSTSTTTTNTTAAVTPSTTQTNTNSQDDLQAENKRLKQELDQARRQSSALSQERDRLQTLAAIPSATPADIGLNMAYDSDHKITTITTQAIAIPETNTPLATLHTVQVAMQTPGEQKSIPESIESNAATLQILTHANTHNRYKNLTHITIIADDQTYQLPVTYQLLDKSRSAGRKKITRYDEQLTCALNPDQLSQFAHAIETKIKITNETWTLTRQHQAQFAAALARIKP